MGGPAEQKGGKGGSPSLRGRRCGVRGILLLLGASAAIALATIPFAVRTESGKALVADWLKKQIGMDVTIGRASIGLPYALAIRELASKDYAETGPGFRAEEVRIGWGLEPRWRITVYRGRLNLVRSTDGSWLPVPYARLGGLPASNIAEISRLTETFRDKAKLRLRDCEIHWTDSATRDQTAVDGIDFEVLPVRMPGRPMHYHHLSVYSVLQPDGKKIHDIDRVWLASLVRTYVEVERNGPVTADDVGGFWMFTAPVGSEEKGKK